MVDGCQLRVLYDPPCWVSVAGFSDAVGLVSLMMMGVEIFPMRQWADGAFFVDDHGIFSTVKSFSETMVPREMTLYSFRVGAA